MVDAADPRKRSGTQLEISLGAFLGLAAFAAFGALGLRALEVFWRDYALAVPLKLYTGDMLVARLGVEVFGCLAAGVIASRVTSAAPWAAGILLLVLTAYIHVFDVWYDYPVWYHVMAVALTVPVTAVAGQLGRRSVILLRWRTSSRESKGTTG